MEIFKKKRYNGKVRRGKHKDPRGRIFIHVRPFYERAVSNLYGSMHRSLWVQVAHSSFKERSHTTKNTVGRTGKLKKR